MLRSHTSLSWSILILIWKYVLVKHSSYWNNEEIKVSPYYSKLWLTLYYRLENFNLQSCIIILPLNIILIIGSEYVLMEIQIQQLKASCLTLGVWWNYFSHYRLKTTKSSHTRSRLHCTYKCYYICSHLYHQTKNISSVHG